MSLKSLHPFVPAITAVAGAYVGQEMLPQVGFQGGAAIGAAGSYLWSMVKKERIPQSLSLSAYVAAGGAAGAWFGVGQFGGYLGAGGGALAGAYAGKIVAAKMMNHTHHPS